jgi:mono/diheme cytochrome c family protein
MLARTLAFLALSVSALACSLRTQPPPGASGAEIYRLQNCANCHGEEREGTRRGPPLAGLRSYWDAERLAEYLVDPPAVVARDKRLAAYDEQYGSSDMGRYDNLDLAQRSTLAAWLLAEGEHR